MRFSKWHGLGNDYLLAEQAELSVPLTPERVKKICVYHFGVGSDGILEVVSVDGDTAEVVIWNPDGSVAELSGNGTRIAARWLARRAGSDRVTILVGPRMVNAQLRGDREVEQQMGAVAVGAAAVANGWCESPVTVHLAGGDLHVELEDGRATLTGPAEEICTVELSEEFQL